MSEYLEMLKKGNERYIANQSSVKNFAKTRAETLAGQKPFAIVLTCSDSRVSPEYIFDVGLGEIFVVRNAGNIVDKLVIESMEYAIEHLHVSLIIILGHEKCGAVKLSWETIEKEQNTNSKIIKKIERAVKKAKKENKTIEDAVNENVKEQIKEILKKSLICKKLVENHKLEIIGAKYSLENGTVTYY